MRRAAHRRAEVSQSLDVRFCVRAVRAERIDAGVRCRSICFPYVFTVFSVFLCIFIRPYHFGYLYYDSCGGRADRCFVPTMGLGGGTHGPGGRAALPLLHGWVDLDPTPFGHYPRV